MIPPAFDMNVRARIPAALCCIHNIIRRYDPDESWDPEVEQAAAEAAMVAKRDEIAESLAEP